MSEGTRQPPDKSTRKHSAQGTMRASSRRVQQPTPAPPPAQVTAAPLAASEMTGSVAPQALPASAVHDQPATDEPPIGERWGEFPPIERRAALKTRYDKWGQKPYAHRGPGPFAGMALTGADVYWLAKYGAEQRNPASESKRRLDFTLFVRSHLSLQEADLRGAQLAGARLNGAQLAGADLRGTQLAEAKLYGADLTRADLYGATLTRANLSYAQLTGARLAGTQLTGARLVYAQLEGADLSEADLSHVDLQEATLDPKTQLTWVRLDATLLVADVAWNDAPLIRVEWGRVPRLGHESEARKARTRHGMRKGLSQRLEECEMAARAYRQLALALRGQGVTEVADRFTYRALIMQRKALWWQVRGRKVSKLGAYLFSLFLAMLTGYGFGLWRMVVAYVLLILAFAGAYWNLDLHRQPQPFSFWQAIILSVTAFHGRVFSNPFNLSDPQIVVTALEAIVGLVIEVVFIAMLTQRFFNR